MDGVKGASSSSVDEFPRRPVWPIAASLQVTPETIHQIQYQIPATARHTIWINNELAPSHSYTQYLNSPPQSNLAAWQLFVFLVRTYSLYELSAMSHGIEQIQQNSNESTNSMLMFRRCRVACNNCCLSFGREKSCTVRVSNSKNIFNIHRVRFATTAPVHSVLKISNHSWLPFSAWLPAILRPGSWHSPNAGRPRHNILRFRRQHQYRDSSRATTRSTPILCDQIREVWFIKFQRKNEFF